MSNISDSFKLKIPIPDNCYVDCREECDTINYRAYQSYLGAIPPDEFVNIKKSKLDEMYYVGIFYLKSEYTVVSQIPKMNEYDLVSAVGGTLSLFIGINFFILVELIEMC